MPARTRLYRKQHIKRAGGVQADRAVNVYGRKSRRDNASFYPRKSWDEIRLRLGFLKLYPFTRRSRSDVLKYLAPVSPVLL